MQGVCTNIGRILVLRLWLFWPSPGLFGFKSSFYQRIETQASRFLNKTKVFFHPAIVRPGLRKAAAALHLYDVKKPSPAMVSAVN